MNRRDFLRRTLSVGAGATALAALPKQASALNGPSGFASLSAAKNWSDASAWGTGSVPGANDVAVITGAVVLDQNVSVAGIHVVEGGELYLDPASSVTIESTGNILVHGLFSLRPSSSVVHKVRFLNVNEAAYVGGGMAVLDSDVGLWVEQNGILDAVGTPKVAWNRTGNDATWSSSDQLIVTPTAANDYDGFQSFSKGSTVPKALGQFPAEVLNLTRNVVFEGTPGGRAHIVFLHAMQKQTVQYVEIRHMGPRQGPAGDSDGVTGRYPLHFHHCGDNSRGSLVEGVAVHQSGNRAFVPHGSHGVTLRNCVAYDIMDDAYWWDFPDGNSDANNTHDGVWDSCVAAWVKSDPTFRGYELAGFVLGHGNNNTCINSVAVGVQGNKGATGFRWPQKGNIFKGVWKFKDNVAHNCKKNGLAVWQNNTTGHHVEDTLIYHLGWAAIHHGAYVNEYHYENITAYDCEHVVDLHAQGPNDVPMLFTNVIGIDTRSEDVLMNSHTLPGLGAAFYGGSLKSMKLHDNPKNEPDANGGIYDFVDTGMTVEGLNVVSMANESVVRIQDGGSAWQVSSNGSVSSIPPFSDGSTPAPPPPGPTTTTTAAAPGPTTTTTAAAPGPTTTTTTAAPGPTPTTTTLPAGGGSSGGNRQRRRRRGNSAGPIAASGTNGSGGSTSVGGDFVAFSSGTTPVAPSLGVQSPGAGAPSVSSVTPPVLGLRGSANAPLPASTGPIAKQLVARAVPVSLNVPAALGPAQASPADPGFLAGVANPAGLALTAAAAAAVVLYRRRIVTTQIPESLRSYQATSVGEGVKLAEGDPWS